MTIIVGATAPLSWAPGGPGAVTLTVRLPDGTLAAAPTVVATTSPYAATLATTQPGRHILTWTRTGDVFVDVLEVWPADPHYLISIDDALAAIGNVQTSEKGDVALFVATATCVVEQLAGPVISAQRTYRTDGGRYSFNLPAINVQVTSITVDGGLLPASSYIVDEEAGIVYGAMGWGRRNVLVTYHVGAAEVPANLALAARKLVRHLWSQERRSGRPAAQEAPADMVSTPFGFAIPKAVAELCALTPSAAGFA